MAGNSQKSLVIVESVAKSKTINKYLGEDYKVVSSVGHIKDLPLRKLGVDIENGFEPEFRIIPKKKDIVKGLRQEAAQSDMVYIATDPDREGEAIAWHIAEELRKEFKRAKSGNGEKRSEAAEVDGRIKRVLFTEITPDGIHKGMSNPLQINLNLVEAQKARRVMDRIVGYQVSPLLWDTICRGLSAGRVQSVALRLICEREVEIEKFIPQEYWSIMAELKGRETSPFLSNLVAISGKKPEIPNEAETQKLLAALRGKDFIVVDIKKREVTRNPAPPFTTSTMQQEASKRLGFTAKRIMALAQQLYEGIDLGEGERVGLITYMRTDSTRIADEALQALREYIYSAYGKEYLPKAPRVFKVKKGAQDAHEAIRPTSMKRDPKSIAKYLTKEQLRLYELIWNRFVASQMEAARLDQTSIDIAASKPDEFLFRTTGSVVTFRGFLQVWEEVKEDEEEEESIGAVPTELRVGERLRLIDLIPKQHFTKPPARYTEASLVKELDNLGIGRPSTYAVILSTLLDRRYVERNARQLVPTELGRTVNGILVQNFPSIFNVSFTAQMEEQLDGIESGKKDTAQVLRDFYGPFSQALKQVQAKQEVIRESLQETVDEKCPKCGSPLVIKWLRSGRVMACTGFPECRFTKPIGPDNELPFEIHCDKCGAKMVPKMGRFGRFLACSNYPDCKSAKPFPIGVRCPKEGCPGYVVELRSRKTQRPFYGCSEYPNCDFRSWGKPVLKACPTCGHPWLEERFTQAKGEFLACPQCKEEFERGLVEAYQEPLVAVGEEGND